MKKGLLAWSSGMKWRYDDTHVGHLVCSRVPLRFDGVPLVLPCQSSHILVRLDEDPVDEVLPIDSNIMFLEMVGGGNFSAG